MRTRAARLLRFWPILLFALVLAAIILSAMQAQQQQRREARARAACGIVDAYAHRIGLLTTVMRDFVGTAAQARHGNAKIDKQQGQVHRAAVDEAAARHYEGEMRALTDLPPLPCG